MSFLGGLGKVVEGIFGNSSDPYDKYAEIYKQHADKAAQTQKPYTEAGAAALPKYQDWLESQKNPSEFINNLIGGYTESPHANYLQQQSLRAGQNAASASGLSGSTPLFQQLQQNSSNIASGDMNEWLKNVLGINTQYGQGQSNLIQGGQNSSNALLNLYNQIGQQLGQAGYGSAEGRNQDSSHILSGGLGILDSLGIFNGFGTGL